MDNLHFEFTSYKRIEPHMLRSNAERHGLCSAVARNNYIINHEEGGAGARLTIDNHWPFGGCVTLRH